MSNVLVEESSLQDIADSIRAKNGTANTYKPGQMAAAIDALPTGGGGTMQSKSVSYTPTETAQSGTVTPDTGYDGLSSVSVSVGAIDDEYVGSGITRRSVADLALNGATFTAPAGYYASDADKTMMTGHMSVSATKGTVSNHSISVTPKAAVDNAGYFATGDRTGTAVTVSASELVSGTKSISQNGTGIDVTEYAAVDVAVSGQTPTGTKNISITANGTTTEDVAAYANAQITANVPNSYTAGDEGKVVDNGALVAQTSDTVTQNGTVDTTLINSLLVNVSGGGQTVKTGTFTPATNTNGYSIDVGIDCTYFVIYLLSTNGVTSSTKAFMSSICDFGETPTNRLTIGTNNSGSSVAGSGRGTDTWWTKSGTTVTCKTGTSGANNPGWFYGGWTYKWIAI